MKKGIGIPTPTQTLVHRLRLMADAGGVLTRDRVKTVIEAADRMEELNEQVITMTNHPNTSQDSSMCP